MINPAVRQELALEEEINQRAAEQNFATGTARAAVAREKVLQAYGHTTWAALGAVVGMFGFIGFISQMVSTGLGFLFPAVGIVSAIWLLTDRARRHGALSRAEHHETVARSARRHLDEIRRHSLISPQLSEQSNSLGHRVGGLAISRLRPVGWHRPHRAGGKRWIFKLLMDVTGWRSPRHTHRGSAAHRHLGFSMSSRP